MAKKTTQQQLDQRLKELRGRLGEEQDKLEELEQYYNKNVSILEGSELEAIEQGVRAQQYIVKQVQEQIEEIKNDRAEIAEAREASEEFKWKAVAPLILEAIEKYHISYNVENNKYTYCMDFGSNEQGIINPVFRSFDGARATAALSKMIDKYLFDCNNHIQKLFITKHRTHYQETASFLYSKWTPDKVYNKAKIISSFWLEPNFNDEPYDSDFDLLIYCVGGGKQENIDHLEQWIAYKYLYPERVANTPNLDCGGSPGGNGKGRYAELCRTVFTPNCIVPAAAKELNDGFNASWELATILLFDEPTEKELPPGKMKQATGGEEQRVERKGVDAYTADRNYSMLALSNNINGVFKLSGTGTGGEDRRYSVMTTNIVMTDEIQRREQITREAAGIRANEIAQKVKNRALVARWLGAMIQKHSVHTLDILRPLHGADYHQRFEDQKSAIDTIFDQLRPVFESSGVITVKIIQDVVALLQDGKKPGPKTVKKLWKEYLNRNKIEYTEKAQDRIDITMQGHVLASQQSHCFRLDPVARQFAWCQISTARPDDTGRDDLLIQI